MFRFLIILFLLTSCAKTSEEKIDSAKQEAKYHLTHGDCSKAKKVLDDVNFQDDDGDYIGLYAATYACKAGYTELGTVFRALENMDSDSLISSTAGFDSSDETEADSDDFLNLMAAINVILDSAGSTPSTVARFKKFGNDKATDLSLQALYMILITSGKYFAYYGNADDAGLKGLGDGTNVCVAEYDFHADVDAWLVANELNGCNSGNDGHPDLTSPTEEATIKTRMCYGIILYNNLLEILGNISLSDNESLGSLSDVDAALTSVFEAAMTFEEGDDETFTGTNSIRTIKEITSQAECEDEDLDDLKRYFFYIIETNFANS